MLQIGPMPRTRMHLRVPVRKMKTAAISVLLAALPILTYGQTSVPT